MDAYLRSKATARDSQQPCLPVKLVEKIMMMRYNSPDVLRIRRSKLSNHAMYCGFHSQCVVAGDGVQAVAKAEKVSLQKACLEAEEADNPQTKYSVSLGRGAAAIMSIAKLSGKPKRAHETLSRGGTLKQVREFEGDSTEYFEKILGSRGDMGLLANAQATLQELIRTGEWGTLDFIKKLDAKSRSTNQLHTGITQYAQSDVVLAQLRVYTLIHICLARPVPTFCQNHSTQDQIVLSFREYRDVLKKLGDLTALSADLSELPWLGGDRTQLISIATHQSVLRTDKKGSQLLKRRKQALVAVKSFPGMSQDRQDTQVKLMLEILTTMAKAMSVALARMMDPKYGSLFSMSDEEMMEAELSLSCP